MKAHLFKKRQKNEKTGYWNTSFSLQGEGMSGTVPINVCYFGKPVMEPVLEKVVDPVTGKAKLDKEGKEIFAEKKDKDGNVVLQAKKDENGKEILRDDDYSVRMEILDMYAGDLKEDVYCRPVDVIAKKSLEPLKNGDQFNYFVQCGGMTIPVEVPDFSTAERTDHSYRANCIKLRILATNV